MDFLSIKSGDDSDLYLSRASTRSTPRDVLTRVTNGMGAQTDIAYAPLTNAAVYRRDSNTRNTANWGRGAAVQDFLAPSYVVWKASSSSPQAGNPAAMADVYYRYAGAKVQAGGRGFLGFREIVTTDPNESGGYITTQTTYSQNFPYIGMPLSTVKRAAIGQTYAIPACLTAIPNDSCFTPDLPFPALAGSWFSSSSQAWEADTDIGAGNVNYAATTQAPVQVRTAGTDENLRDPINNVQTSRVLTTFDYLAYGNVSATTVDTYAGATTLTATLITANAYAGDNPAAWRLGRLSATTVTHRRPSRNDVVRTSSFGYSSVNGILNLERVQPNVDIDQDLAKSYTLDDYGNRTQAIACAAPATGCSSTGLLFHPATALKRYSRTAYDSTGRYPLATYELFWDGAGAVEKPTQTVLARNLFGDVVQATNLNGVDSLAVSGTFGRAYYAWAETIPGSAPGAPTGGVDSYTTYRWCGTGSGQVSCPTGAKFRQKITADGAPTQWSYFDVLGRPVMKAAETFNIGVSSKDVSASCTTYDATGKPKQISNPFFLAGTGGSDGPTGLTSVCSTGRTWTTTFYDVLGRPTDVVAPDTSVVSTDYSGLTTILTDARSKTTTQTRNGKGELTQVVDANGLSMTFWYQADGSNYLVSRDAGRGAVQNTFFFDALGRKTRQIDPDSGTTTFEYNALGELTAQVDSAGNRIENEIDARGRVWRKTVKQADGTVESQSTYDFDTAPNGVGQLAAEAITGTYTGWVGQSGVALQYSRLYSYDSLGRPSGSTTGIDGATYPAAVQYDPFGRPWKALDASGNWAKTEFNARGMTAAVCYSSVGDTDPDCPAPWQRTQATDAWGHVVGEVRSTTGQMTVTRSYWPATGRVQSICANSSSAGTCDLMSESYGWDMAGNLSTQQKETRTLQTYSYDSLNRLTVAKMTMQDGVAVDINLDTVDYDLLGNVCRRTNRGLPAAEFTYAGRSGCGLGGANSIYGGGSTGTAGAHQVSVLDQGDAVSYAYDARGNQTVKDATSSPYDRTLRYSLDDKAYEALAGNGVRTRFWYGSDGQRYKREDGARRTLYLGPVEIVFDAGTVTVKRTIAGVLLQTIVNGTASNAYLFHDQLGSLVRITDVTGQVINSQDYAAFGGRRDYATQLTGGPVPTLTTRGFTGHEMVDGVLGLIHMNGRIFDPGLGRFLQADPLIQTPDNAQSWNAYTYCFNNPYAYTDPTGTIGQKERLWLAVIVAVVYAYFTWDLHGAAAFVAAVAGGAVVGGIATGSWQGALYGAFSAALFYGVGSYFQSAQWAQAGQWDEAFNSGLTWGAYGAKVLAHGVAGGVMSRLQGGSFGSGFAAAGVTEAASPAIDGIGDGKRAYAPARIAAAAAVGGTSSVMTGGKFANGAMTAAFSRAFNTEAHTTSDEITKAEAEKFADAAAKLQEEGVFKNVSPRALNEFLGIAGHGVSSALQAEDYGDLAVGVAKITIRSAIADIEFYKASDTIPPTGVGYQGSLIRWGDVNWRPFDPGLNQRPEIVWRNFVYGMMHAQGH